MAAVNDDDLTTAERELLECCVAGIPCDVSGRPPGQQQIRALLLYQLCVTTSWRVHAKGVQLRGAIIDGDLDFDHATLRAPLRLHDCKVRGAVTLVSATVPALSLTSSELDKPVQLARATIASDLNLKDASLTGTDDHNNSLIADGSHVCGPFMAEGLNTAGAIRLVGATIDETLDLNRAQLQGCDSGRKSLDAARLHVGGSALLSDGFEAVGTVLLSRATIASELNLKGASLSGSDEYNNSLIADGSHVCGPFMGEGLIAAGGIRLVGARIDETLDLNRAQLRGYDTGGKSLDAARLHVGGSALLSDGFEAVGTVLLFGATIARDLNLGGANLPGTKKQKKNNGNNKSILSLHGTSCGEFYIPSFSQRHLELRSFRFAALGGDTSWRQYLKWIRHPCFKDSWSPDPYEQLATWYGRTGDEHAARHIRIARANDQLRHLRRIKPWRSLPYRLWRWSLGLLVGYGYRRWPAGLLLVVTLVGAGVLFLFAERDDAMVPNEPTIDAAGNVLPCGKTMYPCFNSWVYGADVVLPIIDFGQDDAWRPTETAQADLWWIRARWALIAIGWALASVFVAAFTALVQRS